MCTNTEGSYVCRCVKGYGGDGRNCTGKIHRGTFSQQFWQIVVVIFCRQLGEDQL